MRRSQGARWYEKAGEGVGVGPRPHGIGEHIHGAVSSYLSEHPSAVQAVHDLVQGNIKGELPQEHVRRVREILAAVTGAEDVGPVNNDSYSTTVRAGLLAA